MFQFQESQILTPSINGRQELVFKIKVKKEDYTLEDFEKMALMFENTSFAIVLAPFQEEKQEDPLPKLRRQLVMAQKEYCEKWGYKEEDEKQRVYKKYNVISRWDLTIEQLESEIESYKAWTQQFI